MSRSSTDSDRSHLWSGHDPWKKVKHTPGAYPTSPNLEASREMYGHYSIAAAVKARRQEYTRKRQVKIKVGTWNTASVNGTAKDLGGWFVQGLGVKGLSQDLSGLSLHPHASRRPDRHIESVEDQEARARTKSCTLPKHETPAIASDDEIGLYVLGLQEVVDVSSVTEVIRPYYDHNPGKKWKAAMKDALPPGYQKVSEEQLLGLLILVYAAPDVASQISSVHAVSVGTGALGYAGNKGAVSVRIVIGGTTRMLFVNCHLAAGADDAALTRRIWDTNQILERTRFEPADVDGEVAANAHETIGDEDFAFWFGDLNYRLDDIPGEDVRRLLLLHTRNEYDVANKSKRKIDSELGYVDAPNNGTSTIQESDDVEGHGRPAKDSNAEPPLDPNQDPASLITTIKSLLVHDQLRAQQKLRKAFHEGWREGEIGFLPTYKYDVGSVGMFDSGEKKRSPSWCDRILYRTRRDKLEYEDRIAHEAETRKRDADMKARGVEEEVADHEVLFNYDPGTDGADYDEYDEADDSNEVQKVTTHEGFEDVINLEDYVSHQRVLSSDHKPLSAVFTLTYDAVIPELKRRVHQEITKEFDKTENEGRPNVTVVVENPPGAATTADSSTGATELNAVIFDEVRYRVTQTRIITIANTSPISATFAFINRPSDDSEKKLPAPEWLSIHVDQDSEHPTSNTDEFESSVCFLLEPGDIATVTISINVVHHKLVRDLNDGSKSLDDVLVLRVLEGRDHFIRVTGSWLPSSFCRSLDELVSSPPGVRHLQPKPSTPSDETDSEPYRDAAPRHSAPGELFALTEAIPSGVERALADWAMLHEGEDAPWIQDSSWPFNELSQDESQDAETQARLADVREALDTASSIQEFLDMTLPPLVRVQLMTQTLLDFLRSLEDGIITSTLWTVIEERMIAAEKAKSPAIESTDIQEIVMDVLTTAPVHSVSFTFITFMLTRIVSELIVETSKSKPTITPQLPPAQQSEPRSRSSISASEIPSELSSLSSTTTNSLRPDPTRSRLSFLPSLPTLSRKNTASSVLPTAIPSSTTTTQSKSDRRKIYVEAYVGKFAEIFIRAERDGTVKVKDKKILQARKRRVLGAFLQEGTS